MTAIKQFKRLIRIHHILAKNGLDQTLASQCLFRPLRMIVYANPWNWFRKNRMPRGEAIRKTLEDLGPIFVKLGQALSTRPDILPTDIAKELSKLQDKVPPFSSDIALNTLERRFKCSAFELFHEFDLNPLASASMAQVHAATLKTGERVVVKLLRPNIRKVIQQDLRLMHTIARWMERYWPQIRRFKPCEIVQEFEHSILDELDLQREAANGTQLRRNFNNSPLLYIPTIYWDYVREDILVMERIDGIPIADVAQLNDYGINLKILAERGIEIFFSQVFRDCFFHADMHPGNIFVARQNPDQPQYICIDYGIIGTLNPHDQRYLAENLMAFFNRDYRRVAILHVESGWVARNTPIEAFESAIRTVCEPIFEKPLKDISFALVVLRLFQVARRFKMEVQPQLILLQKTLFAVEGLGRQLYPELDLWTTAKPFLERWLKEQMGPRMFIRRLREQWPFFIEELPQMPRLLHDLLQHSKEQNILTLDAKKTHNRPSTSRRVRYTGFFIGTLFTLLLFGEVRYLNGVWSHFDEYQKLAIIIFDVAILGVFFAIMN